MRFEWDAGKAAANIEKHGISFDLAMTVFDDPYALIAVDEKHSSEDELREWIIGESDKGVVVVIFTKRVAGKVYRLISARKANRSERKRYEEFKSFPFEKARRVSTAEVESARKTIESKTGKKRVSRGRPAKSNGEKFIPTSIRLHPLVMKWAKREAKKRGVGYQTVINEFLLAKAV